MGDRRGRLRREQDGFTLLEMLVVTLIIAILAAIAIPVFFSQREKAFVGQSQSVLANAKLSAESYYVGKGSYEGLDEDILRDEGLRTAEGSVLLVVAVSPGFDEYCIAAINVGLAAEHPWKTSSVHSASGTPSEDDTCAGWPA